MNPPLLITAVCAALPACTVQHAGPEMAPGTEAFAAHCAMPDNTQRASSALPARASTRPEPQLGTVAPATRVPSQVETPSTRAMARASAQAAGEKNVPASCEAVPGSPAPQDGAKQG